MKRLMFFVAALLPLLMFAQEFKTTWGETGEDVFLQPYFAGATASNYYLVVKPKKKTRLLKFNLQHKLIGAEDLGFFNGKEELHFVDAVITKNFRCAYLLRDNTKNKQREVYIAKLDDKGKYGEPKLVTTFAYQTRRTYDGGNDFYTASGDNAVNNIYLSPDKTLLMNLGSAALTETDGKDNLDVTVFDENLNVKWEKVQPFPYKDKQMEMSMAQVTNDGTVLLLAKTYDDEGDKRNKPTNYKYKIFIITQTGFKEAAVDLGDKVPLDGRLVCQATGQVGFCGLYSDKSNTEPFANGSFAVQLDCTNGTFSHLQKRVFTEQMVSEMTKDGRKNVLKELELRDVVALENGAAVMVVQHCYLEDHMKPDGKFASVFIAKEPILITMDANLTISREKIAQGKSTVSIEDFAYVKVFAVGGNRVLLLGTDDNINTTGFKAWLFDEQGNLLHEELLAVEGELMVKYLDFTFMPKLTEPIAPNQIVVNMFALRKNILGVLEIK